jgi:hypothetical protein
VLDNCSDSGLLVLELVGEREQQEEFARKLELISGISVKLVNLVVD